MSRDEWYLNNGTLTISHISGNTKNSALMSLEIISEVASMNSVKAFELATEFNNEWYSDDFNTVAIDDIEYTDIINELSVEAHPNPFKETSTLKILSADENEASVVLMDVTGKIVNQVNIKLTQGINEYELNSSSFKQPGIYLYEVRSASNSVRGKVIYVQ